jgi:3-hydroxybutyryl-CoA dehydrogenase
MYFSYQYFFYFYHANCLSYQAYAQSNWDALYESSTCDEVGRNYQWLCTDKATTNAIIELSKAINKVPCVVNDYPGFISNRILMPMINEAILALQEGVADVEDIDTIMKLGMAHPMGPLQLADFIGLDTCYSIMNVLHMGFGNQKYAPATLLANMVQAGFLGVKSGEGFL